MKTDITNAIYHNWSEVTDLLKKRVNLGPVPLSIIDALHHNYSPARLIELGRRHMLEVGKISELDKFSNALFMSIIECTDYTMTPRDINEVNLRIDYVIRNMKMAYKKRETTISVFAALLNKLWI